MPHSAKASARRRGEVRREVDLVGRRGRTRRAIFEHPAPVRLAHWTIALAVPILALSGLQIFRAFPSFGAKIPERDLLELPLWAGLGGWLGGALRWHFTFFWLFLGAGVVYAAYQIASGNWRQVIVSRRDLGGVVPMALHYLRRRPAPAYAGAYNPLQKLAYTTTLAAGALAALSGLALYKPVQLAWLVVALGGFRLARLWHFLAMLGLLAFVPGHLSMVALHGWNNFRSMWTGFKLMPASEATEGQARSDRDSSPRASHEVAAGGASDGR
ncbi:MAG: cytochrome b/b6 domain-containing protein [Thermoanaerobaculia bacterium]